MITDSHVHTCHFSPDATMTADEMVQAAVDRGVLALVVTEHYDDEYPHDVSYPMIFDLNEYYKSFLKWKANACGRVSLRLGIELGYQPQLSDKYNALSQAIPFDSIILSNHLYQGKDPYFFRNCYQKDPSILFSDYITSLTQMADAIDEFDILGHYDYIIRYAPHRPMLMRYEDCPDAFDRLFQTLISKNKSLEINTSTISKLEGAGYSEKDSFPDNKLLLRYQSLGGNRITIGSDAHSSGSVGALFSKTAQYLFSCGFTHNTTFVNRTEMKTPLELFCN